MCSVDKRNEKRSAFRDFPDFLKPLKSIIGGVRMYAAGTISNYCSNFCVQEKMSLASLRRCSLRDSDTVFSLIADSKSGSLNNIGCRRCCSFFLVFLSSQNAIRIRLFVRFRVDVEGIYSSKCLTFVCIIADAYV